MKPFPQPMRPGIRLKSLSSAPKEGWIWQPKFNDERAMMSPDGRVFNRHGDLFCPKKLAQFRFRPCGEWVDLLLLGFRTGGPRTVVEIDYPYREGVYFQRVRNAGAHLLCFTDPLECWGTFHGRPGIEGIVGRKADAPYCFGDSDNMIAIRWKGAR